MKMNVVRRLTVFEHQRNVKVRPMSAFFKILY